MAFAWKRGFWGKPVPEIAGSCALRHTRRRRSPFGPLLIVAVVAAALSGCQAFRDGMPWDSADPAVDDTAAVQTPSEMEDDAAAAVSAPAIIVPQPKPVLFALAGADLIGLSQDQILGYFGSPLRTQDKPPAINWYYEDERCALTLVFFPDLKSERFLTLQYDLKGASEDVCLGQLAQAGSDG